MKRYTYDDYIADRDRALDLWDHNLLTEDEVNLHCKKAHEKYQYHQWIFNSHWYIHHEDADYVDSMVQKHGLSKIKQVLHDSFVGDSTIVQHRQRFFDALKKL